MIGERLLGRVLPLALCTGLVVLLRFGGFAPAVDGPQAAPVAIGYLLLAAFLGGKSAKALGLPRITGYLLVGVLAGPHASALLDKNALSATRAVEGIAVALIALAAGGELRMEWVRRHLKSVAALMGTAMLTVWVGIFALLLLARAWFPFFDGTTTTEAVTIALVFGAIAVSCSPMVTLAVINENHADGPLSRTTLGVVILMDIAVIVLFAAAMAAARSLLGGGGGDSSLAVVLARELGGSIVVGFAIGGGVILFLRTIGRDVPVFVLGLCFGISQLSDALHLEPLLVALAAGFVVENFSGGLGHRLIEGVERLALPIFALFFAVAGAKLDLGALVTVGPLAVLVAAVRAVLMRAGTRIGARLSGADPKVTDDIWLGLISQAGVSLALAATVARAFPAWGGSLQAMVLAMIAVHELIGPVVFQRALARSGEIGAAKGSPAAVHIPEARQAACNPAS